MPAKSKYPDESVKEFRSRMAKEMGSKSMTKNMKKKMGKNPFKSLKGK